MTQLQGSANSLRNLPDASDQAGFERIRALVVDDSAPAQEAVCGLLALAPRVEVVGRAGNGVEAIAAVASLDPELVIMDVNMPYLDGLKACSILTRNYPDLTVLLMSAEESDQLREAGLRHGAHAFLPKQHLIPGLPAAIRELFPGRA
jgi:DNA-binding NarL/FixJ family response regulator